MKNFANKYTIKDLVQFTNQAFLLKYLKLGIIPPGKKTPHFKELSWSKNDFKQAIKYRRLDKDDEQLFLAFKFIET